eukprot:303563-Pelagomonas_calceolata.AAC.1
MLGSGFILQSTKKRNFQKNSVVSSGTSGPEIPLAHESPQTRLQWGGIRTKVPWAGKFIYQINHFPGPPGVETTFYFLVRQTIFPVPMETRSI